MKLERDLPAFKAFCCFCSCSCYCYCCCGGGGGGGPRHCCACPIQAHVNPPPFPPASDVVQYVPTKKMKTMGPFSNRLAGDQSVSRREGPPPTHAKQTNQTNQTNKVRTKQDATPSGCQKGGGGGESRAMAAYGDGGMRASALSLGACACCRGLPRGGSGYAEAPGWGRGGKEKGA